MLIDVSEIFGSISCVGNSSITNSDLMLSLLDNCNFNNTTALSDLIVEAFEANKWVLNFNLVLRDLSINLTLSTFKFDELLVSTSFSVSKLF